MNFSFRPMTRQDFPLLQKWLGEPHVEAWWHESSDIAQIEKKYGPRIDGNEPTHLYVIIDADSSVGWIQWYRWRDYPKHAAQLEARSQEAGIDLALGELGSLGRGLGSLVIREFVESIVFKDPTIEGVVTDPEENNRRSIRAFEKAGFVKIKSVQLEGELVLRWSVRLKRDAAAKPKAVPSSS